MDPVMIGRLILLIGVPAVNELMDLFAKGETVTPEKWFSIREKIKTPFEDLAGPK